MFDSIARESGRTLASINFKTLVLADLPTRYCLGSDASARACVDFHLELDHLQWVIPSYLSHMNRLPSLIIELGELRSNYSGHACQLQQMLPRKHLCGKSCHSNLAPTSPRLNHRNKSRSAKNRLTIFFNEKLSPFLHENQQLFVAIETATNGALQFCVMLSRRGRRESHEELFW